MSMTREEAIKSLKNIVEYWTYKPTEVEAAKMAIAALRPVSREQVVKVWPGCHECSGCKLCIWNETKKCNDCKNRNSFRPLSDFCPKCGKPLTDEAVDMVMERINKMEEITDEH